MSKPDQTDAPETTDAEDTPTEDTAPPPPGLPEYHGRKPTGMTSSFSGTSNRILSPHELGDRAVIVLEVKVNETGHKEKDDGLDYFEKYKVVDMFEAHGGSGTRLLAAMRAAYREASDGPQMQLDGTHGLTDASGNILTEEEAAELRGDPVKAMLDADSVAAFVVVFENGERALWPDEFPSGTDRPVPGDEHDGGVVEELLDAETGEPLDTKGAE